MDQAKQVNDAPTGQRHILLDIINKENFAEYDTFNVYFEVLDKWLGIIRQIINLRQAAVAWTVFSEKTKQVKDIKTDFSHVWEARWQAGDTY